MIEYEWRKGARYSRLDPNAIGAELAALRDNGVLYVEQTLNWARENPGSELHKALEWDDSKAAEEYRLHQMRDIIGSIRHREVNGGDVVVHRSYYSIGGGAYPTAEQVREHDDYQQRVLAAAVRSLEGWRSRYEEILTLCGGESLHRAVGEIVETLKKADAVQLAAVAE